MSIIEDRPGDAETAAAGGDDGKVADLLAVLEVSRQLADTTDLQPLLETIERSALRVLDCERASVFLHDRKADELYSRVATGTAGVRFPAGLGFAGAALKAGRAINVPDAYADPRFNPEVDRRTGFRTRSILSCPLVGRDGEALGVLQVLNKRTGPFDGWDEVLARTYGAQAGVAVQRQILLEESARRRRIEHDLAIARQIQQGLLPRSPPIVPGFDVAGWNRPADETGGDFFDFVELADGTLALTVADATGHGIGPALMVAECRALLRAQLGPSRSDDPAAILSAVNMLLSADLPDERFITAFFGLLSAPDARLRYVSAGQGPLLLYRAASDDFLDLPIQGCPLGVAPELPFASSVPVDLCPGDILAVLTDGFFEWPDPAGAEFGISRLRDLIRLHRSLPSASLISTLHLAVLDFARGVPQADDLTAVVVRRDA